MLAALQQLLYGVQILGCWDWTETDMDLRRLSLWAQIKIATEVARKEQDKHGIQRLGGPGSGGQEKRHDIWAAGGGDHAAGAGKEEGKKER